MLNIENLFVISYRIDIQVLTQMEAHSSRFMLKFKIQSNWTDERLKFKNLAPNSRKVYCDKIHDFIFIVTLVTLFQNKSSESIYCLIVLDNLFYKINHNWLQK